MCLPPRRFRFRVAIRIARLLTPWLVRAGRFPVGRLIAETPQDQTLFQILDLLTRYGCSFDPEVVFEGRELLDRAIDERRGVLLAAPHAMLTLLVFRYLHDRGEVPLVLAGAPTFQVLGCNEPVVAIRAKGSLMRVRTALREGRVVAAMIDRRDEPGLLPFETLLGRFTVADTLLQVAEHVDAQVVMVAYRLDGNIVRAKMALPPPNAGVAEMAAAFAEFTREHVAASYGRPVLDTAANELPPPSGAACDPTARVAPAGSP